MCKPQSEGGKRCAAHTRPPFKALIDAMDAAAKKTFIAKDGHKKARDAFTAQTEEGIETALNIVAAHASTPSGAVEVAEAIEKFKAAKDMPTAAWLNTGARMGETRAQMYADAEKMIKKAKAKVQGHRGGGAGRGSVEKLKRSVGLTDDNNCAAIYPGIEKFWRAEDNDGIGPDQIRAGSNGNLKYRCGECDVLVENPSFRVNNLTKSILDKGRIPTCDACAPQRRARFNRTQAELTSLTDAIGDPEAFNALPPALQYAVLSELGILRGSNDSMSRQVGMSIVNGNLTLKDVMLATDATALDGKVDEALDDDNKLTTITDLDVSATETGDSTISVDQALASTGVLSMIDTNTTSGAALANSVARATNEHLWAHAYLTEQNGDTPGYEGGLDGYISELESRLGRSPASDASVNRFLGELRAVRDFTLPTGYVTERLNKFGDPVTMTPDLSQRRFALMVEDRRTMANWSGTGAGKTLSTTLAIQNAGARETLVVCPKAVRDEWQTEFKAGFPDNSEVIVIDKATDFTTPRPPAAEGVNRVWVVNYDKFSGDEDDLSRVLNPLADRVDAVVFDEIHMAKTSAKNEDQASKRRTALRRFTDRARRANDDLIVVGASATPVVNNLDEAASILRLIEGPESKPLTNTDPTIKNAAKAHERLASIGVRRIMKYPTKMTREDVTIDVTDQVHRIQGRLNKATANEGGRPKRVNPAMMERALLASKMPKVAEIAKRRRDNGEGGTVVYTHYTAGMVAPMRKKLEAEGLRVGTYTGKENATERAATLKKFRNGEIDVIIGSKPIATGVDGLQNASNEMVVVSMPWTAADDDQLVGRLNRRGQAANVKITYLLTEAKAGAARWSWCKDNRQSRVKFKRDIANAAVDGVLPSGSLDSQQHSAEAALGALKDLTAAMAKAEVNQTEVTLTA